MSSLKKMIVVWDLDGPILNVKNRYYATYKKFIEGQSKKPLDLEEYWRLKRELISLPDLLDRSSCRELEDEYKLFLTKNRQKFEYLKLDRLQEGIVDILKTIKNNYVQYLLTMRINRETLLQQMEYLEIESYFKEVLNPREKNNLSSSENKLEIVRKAGLDKFNGVIIGDTDTEAKVANELGWTSVIITNGIRNEKLVRESNPTYILRNLKELPNVKELGLVWKV